MAATVIGGSFLSSFLAVLFDRMASKEVINLFGKPNPGLLRKLKVALLSVGKLLEDSEEKQPRDEHVRQWLNELRDTFYDAEDLLDEIAYEAARFVQPISDQNKVLNCIGLLRENYVLEKKLEDILGRVSELLEEKDALGLREINDQRLYPKVERRTTSLVDESGVFGRDADKEFVIKLILSSESTNGAAVGVIPIVGMGGIGKTTLAQLIYRNPLVREQFQVKAWVCVSEEFDAFNVIRCVLKEVDPSVSTDGMTPNQLHSALESSLIGKRFLLILDDVWDESHSSWDILQMPLKSGAPGSRVLITTRSDKVASVVRTSLSYYLEVLSDEHCWSVLARRAFKGRSFSCPPKLEAIGREIVKKCKGLPLAVIAVGCLLSNELDARKWERILKSDLWDPRSNYILPALWLSYCYLPSNLKRCFAYCSIFPKDYGFEKEELILLWLAEGLLVQHGGISDVKQIGDECFEGLVARSFLQPSHVKSSTFFMHDLTNDLARYVAGEFCFRLECSDSLHIPEKTRHLSYEPSIYNAVTRFEKIYKAKGLRTFLPVYQSWCWDRYLDLKIIQDLVTKNGYLRVLSFSYYKNVKSLPESFGMLKHLRYLSRTRLETLPDSVGKLYNLQVFLLEDCKSLVKLPESIVEMQNLQHLNVGGTPLKMLPKHIHKLRFLQTLILRWCRDMEDLPMGMGMLISLCHLDIGGMLLQQMPPGFGNLTKLQILTDFFVGDNQASSIKCLQNLSNLEGDIRIRNLQNISNVQDAHEANLKCKKNLKALQLIWEGDSNNSLHDKQVLELLRPHTNLVDLSIIGYQGTKFPNWIADVAFSNIISLTLSGCTYCSDLPSLGQLESLKRLEIESFTEIIIVGSGFYGRQEPIKMQPFKHLEYLKFVKMASWKHWHHDDGAFPSLLELHLKDCPNLLGSLPCQLCSLITLRIEGCHQLSGPFPKAPLILDMRIKDDCRNIHFKAKLHRLGIFKVGALDCLLEDVEKMGVTLTSLEEMEVNCDSINTFPLGSFPRLKKLNIYSAYPLPNEATKYVTSLCSLDIRHCHNLKTYFDEHISLSKLTRLRLASCRGIKSLPGNMNSLLPSLLDLELYRCPELELLPQDGLPCKLLSLSVKECEKLIASRSQWNLQRLQCLKQVEIGPCKRPGESFLDAKDLQLPISIIYLKVFGLYDMKFLNSVRQQKLPRLTQIEIVFCRVLTSVPGEAIPIPIASLTLWDFSGLRNLKIGCFLGLRSITENAFPSSLVALEISSLRSLETLDDRIFMHLCCLEELRITSCNRLRALPQGLPLSLRFLVIRRCRILSRRCQWEGEDWHKISHIPSIVVNHRLLK